MLLPGRLQSQRFTRVGRRGHVPPGPTRRAAGAGWAPGPCSPAPWRLFHRIPTAETGRPSGAFQLVSRVAQDHGWQRTQPGSHSPARPQPASALQGGEGRLRLVRLHPCPLWTAGKPSPKSALHLSSLSMNLPLLVGQGVSQGFWRRGAPSHRSWGTSSRRGFLGFSTDERPSRLIRTGIYVSFAPALANSVCVGSGWLASRCDHLHPLRSHKEGDPAEPTVRETGPSCP